MFLSNTESVSSVFDSEPSEDAGRSEAGSYFEEESEMEPQAPFRLLGVAILRTASLLLDGEFGSRVA